MKKAPLSPTEKKYLNKLAKRLKEHRIKAGYSNYENFAFSNEIGRTQYGKYETGGNIQFTTLVKILKALDITFEEFFKGFD